MEGRHQQQGLGQARGQGRHQQQASGTMVIVASVIGLAIGGSLLGLMGLTFLASLTLLLFSSPLLLIFSPLLFFASLVFVGSLVGFAAAATMALTGVSALGWIFQEVGGQRLLGFGGGDVAGRVKEQSQVWGRYLQQGGMGI
ncbi:putative oleosin [Rosa chinensis]|uniref:Putative oleosin n=1 Tax=Rosa chinensis TaxID=74649 RepID=A0A2P6QLC7_ROSCH|nr:oleosin [Rosa chinensis]PRQ34986.1 putative oleosin [Rosa chinensis]